MNLQKQTILKKVGKTLAKPLCGIIVNSMTESLTLVAEEYLCTLLGKGAGTGWALEVEVRAATKVVLNASPIIFDVGANMGEWSFLFHQLCPEASIYLFEPQPTCQKKISERNISKSILIPNAVSSTSGETIKLFTSEDTTIASLHQRRDSYFIDRSFSSVDVLTVTIDEIMEKYQLPCVDFMKIDVEGHELAVLNGAIKSLKGRLIKALSFEFGSGNLNSRTFFHDFWDMLTPLGFHIFRILPSSRLMPINKYSEDCEYFRGATNYIAILK